jgi:hypothetical protein
MMTAMQAVVLLADSAQTDPSNKLHALGLGWSVTTTPTPPAAVAVLMKVPWHQTNTRHQLLLRLVDADGRPAPPPTESSPGPLVIEAEFEVGRPAGLPEGMAIDQSFTVVLGPGLPLDAGEVYEWRLDIDGQHEEGWSARFFVRRD